MYEKAPFSAIGSIFSNGPSFYNTDGPANRMPTNIDETTDHFISTFLHKTSKTECKILVILSMEYNCKNIAPFP